MRIEISLDPQLDRRLRKRAEEVGCDLSQIVSGAIAAYLSVDPENRAAAAWDVHDRRSLVAALRRAVGLNVLCCTRVLALLADRSAYEGSDADLVLAEEGFAALRADLFVSARQVADAVERLSPDQTSKTA